MNLILADKTKPKPKVKKKLAKAAQDDSQTKLVGEDARVEQFKVALKVIDESEALREKISPIENISDLSGLRREFNSVMTEVFRNIVPKTIPLPLRTSWSYYGLNRFGPAKRSRYSSRFGSESMSELFGHERDDFTFIEDLENLSRYSDKGVALPKEYDGLTPAQIFLKMAISAIKTHKFRTRKRSLERLNRVYDFVTANEALLKQHEDTLQVDVGERLVWNKSAWRRYNRNSEEEGFSTAEMRLKYDGHSLRLMNDDYEFSLSRVSSQLDHAFAFASLYSDFDKQIAKLLKIKEARCAEVQSAIDKLRKKFARELLVAKAKQITS